MVPFGKNDGRETAPRRFVIDGTATWTGAPYGYPLMLLCQLDIRYVTAHRIDIAM